MARSPVVESTPATLIITAHGQPGVRLPMKRLQIMIEEECDLRLDHEATRTGVSKAALVRRFVRDGLQPLPPLQEDPLFQMIGVDDVEPMDVDSVVYS